MKGSCFGRDFFVICRKIVFNTGQNKESEVDILEAYTIRENNADMPETPHHHHYTHKKHKQHTLTHSHTIRFSISTSAVMGPLFSFPSSPQLSFLPLFPDYTPACPGLASGEFGLAGGLFSELCSFFHSCSSPFSLLVFSSVLVLANYQHILFLPSACCCFCCCCRASTPTPYHPLLLLLLPPHFLIGKSRERRWKGRPGYICVLMKQ